MPGKIAPAKINLALHVTEQRGDGYHLLESPVVFTTLGDVISASPEEVDRFIVTGPEAGALADAPATGNLIVRARDLLRQAAREAGQPAGPVRIQLDKQLPVASGIGGGSADAAAALRLLAQLWNFQPGDAAMTRLGLRLGADVPMCLAGEPLVARGIGEMLTPLRLGFQLDMVIVNPRVSVSTPEVFAALASRDNPPLPSLPGQGFSDQQHLLEWLGETRNDLETPALGVAPAIAGCLGELSRAGAGLARMSGSGASCFGLFHDAQSAQQAAARLRTEHPGWFVAASSTLAGR